MLKSAAVIALALLASAPALANDSTAEIKTGGLVLTRTDAISMDSEELFISLDEVHVAYRFLNHTDADVDAIVAFPMPDIQFNPYGDTALPDPKSDNFLGFKAWIEGQPVAVQLEQKAFAADLDVTDILKQAGVPLFPFGDDAFAALNALPPDTLKNWVARGLVFIDRYDVGDGMKDHPTPFWVLKSTYWWRMTFPAGRPIMVEHRYAPSVGGTVGVTFYQDGRFGGPTYDDYRQRYCIDKDFEQAILKGMAARGDEYPPYFESRISYVLKTASNWAGAIGSFSLTVDKGSPKNLVSFCGTNVHKVGPTLFEMTATDFYPERDLDVLILKPAGN
jgi:hypothetical protein